MWINENEGTDLNHAGRVRVAKKINQMIHAAVIAELRRCARICENIAKDADAMVGGHSDIAGTALGIRLKILRREKP